MRRTRSIVVSCVGALLTILLPAQDPERVTLTGRVVDETGAPIAGAAVGTFAWHEFVDTAKLLVEPQTRTGDDGVFTLEIGMEAQNGYCVIAARGRQSCALQIHGVTRLRSPDFGDTVLPPGVQVIGRVRDEAGKPVPGARVRVETSIADRYAYQKRLLAGATSDAKGIFVVAGVPRTGLSLFAEADGYLVQSRLVAQESPIDLVLEHVGMVRGRVVDAAGAPLAGLTIGCMTSDGAQQPQRQISAADGTFAITVPTRGRFRITAYESRPPHRQLSSGLLRGAQDDVVVRPWDEDPNAGPGDAPVVVTVVDATTKSPIERFRLAAVTTDPTRPQTVLFHHRNQLRSFEGEATVERRGADRLRGVLVEAAGHGFAIAPVPEAGTELRVELGPEAVLIGTVTDAETGKAMAGVPVRALPAGTSTGSGGTIGPEWPVTDTEGNYRITGLCHGDYEVQVHARDRASSPPLAVTLRSGEETRLDLQTPAPRWLEVHVLGEPPTGTPVVMRLGDGVITSGRTAGFHTQPPQPPPVIVHGPGKVRFGPIGHGGRTVEMFVPSRSRVASGTTIQLGQVTLEERPLTVDLGNYAIATLRGTIQLPDDMPSERIGVLATPVTTRNMLFGNARPSVAGIDGARRFALDLLTGPYCLQLVDLQTGIVFHTEERDLAVTSDITPLTLRPGIHWLSIECTTAPGAEVALRSLGVDLVPPRDGAFSPFLDSGSGSNRLMHSWVAFRPGEAKQRWLVPEGPIVIKPQRSFEMLLPWARGWKNEQLPPVSIEIDGPQHEVTIELPPPPSDEELLKR